MTEIIPGFEKAQAEYDRQEPPEYPPCRYCDDQGTLEVASLYDVDGDSHEVPDYYVHSTPCPWCPTRPLR